MASNQKNNKSNNNSNLPTEVSTPVIDTPPLNAPPPQLNATNLSKRLGTLKRKANNSQNSVGKQLWKQYKGMKYTNLKRGPILRKFDIIQTENEQGRKVKIVTHRETGEEVEREYYGGKRRVSKHHRRLKRHSAHYSRRRK